MQNVLKEEIGKRLYNSISKGDEIESALVELFENGLTDFADFLDKYYRNAIDVPLINADSNRSLSKYFIEHIYGK